MKDEWSLFVKRILDKGYANEKIANTMQKIPRKDFLPEDVRGFACMDQPLPIGHGQTTSQPSIIAYMLKELDADKGMNVLEVGAGSGWVCALLSELVGENGRVTGIERIRWLYQMAKENLEDYKNVDIVFGDGRKGYEKNAPYDRILISAAANKIPSPLFDQLKEKGRMILPVGSSFWQELILVEKIKNKPKIHSLLPVLFVPLVQGVK